MDEIRRTLINLHSGDGQTPKMSWAKIASLKQYRGINRATLSAYARGRSIVNKEHRKILGLPPLVKVPADMVRRTPPAGTGRKRAPRVEIALSDLDCAVDRLNKKTGKKWSYE